MVFKIKQEYMSRKIYPYVDDSKLIEEVALVINSINTAINNIDASLYKNVIDPFSALFDASSQNITYAEWIDQEKRRQLQKTFQNTIGYFHEHIIGHMDGWLHLDGGGYDVENKSAKIIAEIKNKHNTMNSSSAEAVYTKMVDFLNNTKKKHTAYVVTIIPKTPKPFSKNFCPSVRGKKLPSRDDLKITDGASFYKIATGDKDALKKLYAVLPSAIKEALSISNSAYKPELVRFEELLTRAFI
jgi:Eco47II restriction endonuclease